MNRFFTKRAVFLFAFPGLVLFSVFVIYPMIPQLLISFQSHNGAEAVVWVGLENYRNLFRSAAFGKVHWNTYFIVFCSLFIALPISLVLALLLDRTSPHIRAFFKFGALFPSVLSVTVIGKMWTGIYDPDWGILNTFLRGIGLGNLAESWLTDPHTVVPCIAAAFLWQYVGLNCILFYAGIKAIPEQYFEAAIVDGAGFWRASLRITIPLLQDIIKYVVIVSTLGSMGMYAHILVMTAGGPGDASRSVLYQMYYKAFSMSQFGEGCAIAVVFIVECMAVSLLINKTIAREPIQY